MDSFYHFSDLPGFTPDFSHPASLNVKNFKAHRMVSKKSLDNLFFNL